MRVLVSVIFNKKTNLPFLIELVSSIPEPLYSQIFTKSEACHIIGLFCPIFFRRNFKVTRRQLLRLLKHDPVECLYWTKKSLRTKQARMGNLIGEDMHETFNIDVFRNACI